MKKYAVLGPSGTFSEEAVRLYCESDIELLVTENIPDLFAMVESGQVSDGLVPLENSTTGLIAITMECLAASSLKICGAIEIPIKQCILANGSYEPAQIEILISQPVALEQCRNYIKANLKGVRTEITDSTARAAQLVQNETRKAAAIGSEQLGHLYGLQIIDSNIQDGLNNTRFIHVAKKASLLGDIQKSSIILSLKDKVGALYNLLGVFARGNLNLSKIESRSTGSVGEYIFYIEVEQGEDNIRMELFLPELKPYCNWVKYLGSYAQRKITAVNCHQS